MRRNCDQAIAWDTPEGPTSIVCTPTVAIAVSEVFLKTLGFCLTLSFSVLKLQTHSTWVYISISTVSAIILNIEKLVHVDKLALE